MEDKTSEQNQETLATASQGQMNSSQHSQTGRKSADLFKARLIGGLCLAAVVAMGIPMFVIQDDTDQAIASVEEEPVVEPAPVIAVAPEEAPLEPLETTIDTKVKPGDTLMTILTNAGAERVQAHAAVQAMADEFSPRQIKPGQELSILLEEDPDSGASSLKRFGLVIDPVRTVVVSALDDGFTAEIVDKPIEKHMVRAEGTIDSSLYVAAVDADVPLKVLGKMIDVFSFDVDFQREIQQGDRFALMFEEMRTDEGASVDQGAILMAEMVLSGHTKRYYRFKDENGFYDYYDAKGQSARKALLKTPVDGARISSRFGKRKHPILGYTKKHTGVDFAAPRGTPIYAAGDGVIEFAGRNGSYGNYVRIRHNGTYHTAYAHMKGFAKGMRKGKRVRQRQVIGYVGTTGRSTGPHLHFEVHKNKAKVNPLSVKLPTGKTLEGNMLAAFKKARAAIDAQYAALPSTTRVADASQATKAATKDGETTAQ